ncbi:MAG: fold metallo-hydrolase [Microvirga sp.]|jgi:glyoxylase-like metal-dependent hydrolase (beta-lactamase superfamily II)|nr:fold metallo-hydrolase [Microvirga sp.]
MILRQFLHHDPIGISYLFGCGRHASGAVVDPVGDIAPYLRASEETGIRIKFVVDTHIHADHLSAGRQLAEATGADYVLSSRAQVGFPFRAVEDDDVLPLGNVIAAIMHTPGRTSEHLCLLVTDRTRADEPWFVLTAHTLMIGDLGRTGARLQRRAGRERPVPEHPAAQGPARLRGGSARRLAGSVCGRRLSGKPISTIGFEKRHNAAFRTADEAEFVRVMTAEIPPAPPEAARLRALNAGATAAPA